MDTAANRDDEGENVLGTDIALLAGAMSPSLAYRPRYPDEEALHQIVRDHYQTFRAQAAGRREGQGLPRFVERAFEDFLTCGCLAAGFARFRCAAHLVEYVFPEGTGLAVP